jgi:hypothetical protein
VNNNIRILMLFDCMRVNTGLGSHWICNSGKKSGVYVNWWCYQSWTIFLFLTCWSFLIGENISIWMSPFRFESSYARDGGMWWNIFQRKGGPYLVVEVRGILLPWVILRREGRHGHIWISNFLWRQFWGVGLCPYMGNGRGLPIYGDATTPQVFRGAKMS